MSTNKSMKNQNTTEVALATTSPTNLTTPISDSVTTIQSNSIIIINPVLTVPLFRAPDLHQCLFDTQYNVENRLSHDLFTTTMDVPTFVLSIGGSFNPVHCSHIEIMEAAKSSLEQIFPNSNFIGFLATSLSSHVRKKCGKNQTIKKEHRIAMTNLVAKEETTWIQPTTKCYGAVLNCLEEFLRQQQGNSKKCYLVEVVGGDKAKPSRRTQGNRITIIISRKGHNEKLLAFQKRKTKKKGIFAGKVPPKNSFVDGNDMFIVLEKKGEDISSSRVRKVLEKLEGETENGRERKVEELVEQNLIRPIVAKYILSHWNELYETAINSMENVDSNSNENSE